MNLYCGTSCHPGASEYLAVAHAGIVGEVDHEQLALRTDHGPAWLVQRGLPIAAGPPGDDVEPVPSCPARWQTTCVWDAGQNPEQLFVATELFHQVLEKIQRKQARVLLLGPEGSGKTSMAMMATQTMGVPRDFLLSVGAKLWSRSDVVAAVGEAAHRRTARVIAVDGIDELREPPDETLTNALDRAAGASSLLLTSRFLAPLFTERYEALVIAEWTDADVHQAIEMRYGTTADKDQLEALLRLVKARRGQYPRQVVGAANAFLRGGLTEAGHWLAQEQLRAAPELLAVADADGKIELIHALRMPNSRVATASSTPLRIAPLIIVGAAPSISRQIAELEELINTKGVKEADLQKFFEKHPQLLQGIEYDKLEPHPVLVRQGAGPLIPDFMLEPAGGFADILDLKLPDVRLTAGSKDRRRWSSKVSDAIAQVREYGAYFDSPIHREFVESKYGMRLYRPKVTVVIGRTVTDDDWLQQRRVWSDVPHRAEVLTYDDLLARARRLSSARRW